MYGILLEKIKINKNSVETWNITHKNKINK